LNNWIFNEEKEMPVCPSCNFSNTEGTRFCVKCGTPLQTDPSAPRTSDSSGGATTADSSSPSLQETVLGSSQKTTIDETPPTYTPDSGSIPTMYAPYTPASPMGSSSPGMTSSGGGSAEQGGGFGAQGGVPAPFGTSASGSGAASSGAGGAGATSQVNPPLAAIISFFFPGLGLLLVPNKLPLALGIFGGSIVLIIALVVITGILSYSTGSGTCTLCAFPLALLIQIGAALFTYDTAAKLSNDQYKPIVFKK
jgi:hypothetical protein